jgi:hypothetical protein
MQQEPTMTDATIYELANFEGRGIFLDTGEYRLFGLDDMNDTISSIQVSKGIVVVVYEHADSGGGYGISADFLEDCPDLAIYNLDDKISYLSIFGAEQPSGLIWRRGRNENGQYIPGHWERKRVVEAPSSDIVAVSPPIPPRVSTLVVHATGPLATQARTLFTVFLDGPDNPQLSRGTGRFDTSSTCTFNDLPPGQYRLTVDTKADIGWGASPSRVDIACHPNVTAEVLIRFG